jgi:purine-binding chemotaxis protein CheW
VYITEEIEMTQMDTSGTKTQEKVVPHVAGKYMTFSLSREKYGVEILKVIEINSMMHITTVPRCAPYMKGVVNLRGKIIPVVDLRMLFGMEPMDYDDKTCTIIVNAVINGKAIPVGMIVDRVLEVTHFDEEQIAPPPEYGSSVDSRSILGIGKTEQHGVVILMDVDKLLDTGDTSLLLQHER